MDITTNLVAAKSMISGVLAANGIYNLNNPEFLDYVRNKKQHYQKSEKNQRIYYYREQIESRLLYLRNFHHDGLL